MPQNLSEVFRFRVVSVIRGNPSASIRLERTGRHTPSPRIAAPEEPFGLFALFGATRTTSLVQTVSAVRVIGRFKTCAFIPRIPLLRCVLLELLQGPHESRSVRQISANAYGAT